MDGWESDAAPNQSHARVFIRARITPSGPVLKLHEQNRSPGLQIFAPGVAAIHGTLGLVGTSDRSPLQ